MIDDNWEFWEMTQPINYPACITFRHLFFLFKRKYEYIKCIYIESTFFCVVVLPKSLIKLLEPGLGIKPICD